VNDWLATAFSFVCGQNPDHLWVPGGLALPCCQRCTGLYGGALLAVLLTVTLKPLPTTRFRWAYALLLLQMAPFGFHWVPQGAVLRTLSGALFAFGLVGCLGLLPAGRWWKEEKPVRHAALLYFLGIVGGVAALLGLCLWGGRPGGFILSGLVTVGAFSLAGLAALDFWLLAAAALDWRRKGREPTRSSSTTDEHG
jgi:uncharacterized membrane protein